MANHNANSSVSSSIVIDQFKLCEQMISNPDAGHHHCDEEGRTDCWDAENDYIGEVSTTISGRTCMHWDEKSPHRPRYIAGHHNYCRNPDNDSNGPWCYTTDKAIRFEYCSIPVCGENHSEYESHSESQSTTTTTATSTLNSTLNRNPRFFRPRN